MRLHELIRVAVVDPHEIFGRGLVACLADDRRLEVTAVTPGDVVTNEFHVAVVSAEVAGKYGFSCPVVVCGNGYAVSPGLTAENEVAGLLRHDCMTGAQLRASVHAAVNGLKLEAPVDPPKEQLEDPRLSRVLRLIADGNSTREMAAALGYSERTIKKLITRVEAALGARTRAHAVALAIRQGLM